MGTAVKDTLLSDYVLELLQNCADPERRKLLVLLCRRGLEKLSTDDLPLLAFFTGASAYCSGGVQEICMHGDYSFPRGRL